jgi:lipopolysaccharide/colanic/teichoic acid biosynthesis glycosyltransferase/transposase-like protein
METKLPNKKRFITPPLPVLGRLKIFQKEISTLSPDTKIFTTEEKARIVVEGQSGQTDISDICLREQITPDIFLQWSKELINNVSRIESERFYDEDDKFRLVLEGLNGEFSVAEICRREGIKQELFLSWSHDFLQTINSKLINLGNKRDLTFQKRNQIREIVGEEGLWYFESYLSLNSAKTLIFNGIEDLFETNEIDVDHIICIKKINDIRHINKFFEMVNQKLDVGSIFIGCLETFSARKERKWVNNIPILNDIYFGGEFVVKRILPKLSYTKSLYFDMTKGRDRLLSKAEGLGRLVSCGFKIMDHKTINGLVYFVVQKEKEPTYDMNPSYGPIYAMPRLGKNGKIIKVYKMRTMHPYSEYLQDYVIRAHGYAESGKPAEDFRIPAWGKVMRKYWLDELPQLYNFLKGDLKLIGIRPVSARYFQDIPKEMQKLRLTQKPGCIPPYVSLNRSGSVMSVLQAEKEYLEEKIKNPYTTDIKYFFKAMYSIIFKHKRSA